jgi:hypothetical protein
VGATTVGRRAGEWRARRLSSSLTAPTACPAGGAGPSTTAVKNSSGCSQNGILSSRGGYPNRWHSLVSCEHGDATTRRFDSPRRSSARARWRPRRSARRAAGPSGAPALQPKRLLIESRWVSKPLASAGKLRPRRFNNHTNSVDSPHCAAPRYSPRCSPARETQSGRSPPHSARRRTNIALTVLSSCLAARSPGGGGAPASPGSHSWRRRGPLPPWIVASRSANSCCCLAPTLSAAALDARKPAQRGPGGGCASPRCLSAHTHNGNNVSWAGQPCQLGGATVSVGRRGAVSVGRGNRVSWAAWRRVSWAAHPIWPAHPTACTGRW